MSKKSKRIFITGSDGFIGSYLAAALKKLGYVVRGYDTRSSIKDDVRNYRRLKSAMAKFKPDGVVHLAAIARVEDCFYNPKDCVEINFGGTFNILEILRDYKNKYGSAPWFIFGSSREVFGNPAKFPVTEDAPKQPLNIYASMKVAGELLCQNYARYYGVRSRVVRFSGVYTGVTDQLKRVIPRFIIAALKNKPLVIEGGRQFFDFVHINDAVEGVLKCINHIENNPTVFEDFSLVTGKPMTVTDLAKLIISLTGSQSPLNFVQPRSYDVNGFCGDPGKVNKVLGWRAKIDLRQGLKKCLPEFQKHIKQL